jgi:alcohol dehydrogenase class IV
VNFEFATAGRILFGEGRLSEAGPLARALGTRALVVQGSGGRADPLVALLAGSGVATCGLAVRGEPTVGLVEQGVEQARREGCDVVVAMGGGSVIDAGKAIAALLTNPGEVREYLEVIGAGRPLSERPAPLLALPTTAGTGAEVTRNAVLAAPEERVKVSLRSPLMLPAIALIDPELTYSLPASITASTGLDALTQCIEPFVTPVASPLSDAVAREGMRRAAGALRRAVRDGSDVDARRDMAIASLCGGLALANAKLGAVHGFAAPLGGMFPVPHGIACARLLAPVMMANLRALREREADSPALRRYDEVARVLAGKTDARAEDGAAWVEALVEELGIPGLSQFGIAEADGPAVVEKAMRASSMQGNPIALTREELARALHSAL